MMPPLRPTNFSLLLLFFLLITTSFAQQPQALLPVKAEITGERWDAAWISHPTASLNAHGVFYFRRIFELSEVPLSFIVHVSADNRYELYVNGERVVLGPAWGDLHHWRFESIDIAPYLRAGKNIVAAQVVNFGHSRAVSQFSFKTGFILQGESEQESMLNTSPENWEVIRNPAFRPIVITFDIIPTYYATNPTDSFEAKAHLWQWKDLQNDYTWRRPIKVANGTPRNCGHYFQDQSPWLLTPRNIPFLEERKQTFAEVERTEEVTAPDGFLQGTAQWEIPARTKATMLIDQGLHTRAFPELHFSGGDSAEITIKYAEALFDENGNKGNRDEVAGKELQGYYDIVRPDGQAGRSFRPLWYRIFRYVELEIETKDEPLTIDSLYSIYTAYPYQRKGYFETDNSDHRKLFEIGWRTLRNGTAEVFEDGPYYEQLMYAGDARIESLVSLYTSGDERMTKNVIDLFDNSRIPEGLTLSRYPSNLIQINPQYSLCWVQMIHDFMQYTPDTAFAYLYLDGIAGVINWHRKLIDDTGMLGEVPWLRHIEAKSGTPKHPERGHSAQQTLFFALTLDLAAEIFRYYQQPEVATRYDTLSQSLKAATYRLCWDNKRALLGDTPEKDVFTQHANVLGILTDAIPAGDQPAVMKKVLGDTSLLRAYLFFHFWIFQALEKSGLGNEFLNNIGLWERLLDYGFTTFPEFDVESRSDCHPWSTHINYFFLTTVAGIKPDGFGFERVNIAPHPGNQRYIAAGLPHPKGLIELIIDRQREQHFFAEILLPNGLAGTFFWNGKEHELKAGRQVIDLSSE